MSIKKEKQEQELRRKRRVKAKVQGTLERPRLTVARSQKHIYVQLINDETGRTLASASDLKIKVAGKKPLEISREVGRLVAEIALKQKITKAVFDRAGYKYHGNVKAVAEGAREGGLQF